MSYHANLEGDASRRTVVYGLIAVLFWTYLLLLPLAHWLAPSGWLPLPNIPLMLAALLCLVGGVGSIRLAWRDVVLLTLVAIAVISTLGNVPNLTAKSLNHMAALLFVSILNYFVGGRLLFSVLKSRWKLPLLLGFVFACVLCVFEFTLVNFFSIPLPGYRPSAMDYDSTFVFGVRPRSTFFESGHFAFYLACLLPVLVAAYGSVGNRWVVRLVLGLFLLCAVLLFSTSLFLLIAIWGGMYLIFRRLYLKPIGLAAIGLFVAISLYFWSEVVVLADVLVLHKFRLFSFEDRQEKFVAVLELIGDSSFVNVVIGYGMGSFSGLSMADSISSYANFLRDAGIIGLLLFVLLLIPLESLQARLPREWQAAFLFVGVGLLLFFSAVPNYYFPHLAFVLGIMSTAGVTRVTDWSGASQNRAAVREY